MKVENFFYRSTYLDRFALKPLSHIRFNWDLTWDTQTKRFIVEEDSFAKEFNYLIDEMEKVNPPQNYHQNEDILAEYVKKYLRWNIQKVNGRWVGADYNSLLEQGGFRDINEQNLVLAAAGRIKAAIKYGQKHFDEMEKGHMIILATVLSVILYHRFNLANSVI